MAARFFVDSDRDSEQPAHVTRWYVGCVAHFVICHFGQLPRGKLALDPLLFSGVLIHRAALGAGSNHSHAPPILGNGLPCLIGPRYHRLIGESRDVLKFSLASAAGDELRATRKTTDTTLPPNPSLTFDEGNVITKPVPVVSTASSRIDPRFDCDELGIYFLAF